MHNVFAFCIFVNDALLCSQLMGLTLRCNIGSGFVYTTLPQSQKGIRNGPVMGLARLCLYIICTGRVSEQESEVPVHISSPVVLISPDSSLSSARTHTPLPRSPRSFTTSFVFNSSFFALQLRGNSPYPYTPFILHQR